MCRLFGLHAGLASIPATFWLLDAPDSLAAQSQRNPDGAGIGVFERGGVARIDKQPIAAFRDPEFATAAHERRGTTFLAHVRYASSGPHTMANTHPFLLQDRMFAHNGVLLGLPELDHRLAELGASELVKGDTDSERVFALITAEVGRRDGDVGGGMVAAVNWIAEHLPLYALNLVLTTATDLWALRYPATHELYVLRRPAGGADGSSALDARTSRIGARSRAFAENPCVVVATEKMDDEPGWKLLEPGELLQVNAELEVTSGFPFPSVPAHLLELGDLGAVAASSQHPRTALA